jgi:hypothetical protein
VLFLQHPFFGRRPRVAEALAEAQALAKAALLPSGQPSPNFTQKRHLAWPI